MTIKELYKFLILSWLCVVIAPSLIYFILILIVGVEIPFWIAVYLMLFSGLTNMEIWILSVWTARKTVMSVEVLKEKAEYYENLIGGFFSKNSEDNVEYRDYIDEIL